MSRTFHRVASIAGFALAVALLLLVMHALSRQVTMVQLQREAGRELHALQNHQPLWIWSLRRPPDLVAGHPFGAATAAFDDGRLRITSRDGSPYDLGLPLMQPVDLAHWPLLRLHVESSADGELGLILQASEQGATCLATSAAELTQGATELTVDLRKVLWQTVAGERCPSLGVLTHMLRLRPHLPTGATLHLRDAALIADPPAPAVDAGAAIELPADLPIAEQRIAQLSLGDRQPATPLFHLPASAAPETWLTLRDRLRQHWPAALIVPAGVALLPSEQGAMPAWFGWTMCGTYLLLLAWLAARPPPGKTPPWLEVAAFMTGPLWLIAGLQWGLHPSIPAVIAFVAALLYAAVIEWRRRPADWRWLSGSWRDWAWPLAMAPVALGLIAWSGQAFAGPGGRHVLTYLAWATLQQWAALAVVMRRLERLPWPRSVTLLVTATLFALLHTPNGALMQLCLLAELWWAWCFLRSRALLPIALAHAVCALLVESGLTGGLLRSLEVSARFFL
ncbi:CPBP family intramembrane glutamic endopeptidase [Dyella subtropica]|uniref:CPBP family intramembrane glutamic endopeptidase n=1 Tax=Dyella subtropica TaxID=2992127 RepID=UPI00225BF3D0|nr:CPBP family intramembrane glutamic endopeptidase [Dyella subtropica]